MKRYLRLMLSLSLLCCMNLMLVGCTKGDPVNQTNDETAKADIQQMIEQGKSDAQNAGEEANDKVEEAIKYIDEHADNPFDDHETTKQLAYYGSYLENVAGDSEEAANHEFTKLGRNIHTFINNISSGVEKETSEVSKGLRKDIDDGLGKIKEGKDDLMQSFRDLLR